MRHGHAYRQLSRPTAHRMAMLRNLVSSLLFHQHVRTTLAKAKEAARLAEKMIQLGKKGTLAARREAEAFVMNPKDTLPLLFTTYAERYAHRPGGYTRIHKFGHRPGDYAPAAIIELVDSPRDIKFAVTARAVGRETLDWFVRQQEREGASTSTATSSAESDEEVMDVEHLLRERTKWNRAKVLKYRGEEGVKEMKRLAKDYITELLAEPTALSGLRRPGPAPATDPTHDPETKQPYSLTRPKHGRRALAGERLSGMNVGRVGLNIATGAMGRRSWAIPKLVDVPEGWKPRKAEKEVD